MASSQHLVMNRVYGRNGNKLKDLMSHRSSLVAVGIEKINLLCYNCNINYFGKEAIFMKRLAKSPNRMILGVCAGIAEYFNLDPTVVRLLWVLFCLMGGSGILGYIIAAVIMPYEDEV